jgi:ParB family chromosome partitioning protein
VTKKALGKGLEALIPKKAVEEKKGGLQQIPISKIKANPTQPRKIFKSEDLQDLVNSVREKGILQPITVRKKGEGWEIVAGERRWRAAQKLGLLTLPALEVLASDVESLEWALIENLQRVDLNPIEEAQGYHRLQEEFQMTQEQISQKVGKDRATVANALRLLKLTPEVQSYLASGRLTSSHARVLAALQTPQEQKKWADKILHHGISVREVEQWLQNQKGPTRRSKTGSKAKDPNIDKLEGSLRDWLGTKVTVKTQGKQKGVVKLEYYSLDDLDRILNLFRKAGYR